MVDAAGAGLADLKVIAANQTSGAEKEVRSDPDGSYALEVEPGTYTVRVEKTGMGQAGVRDVVVNPGDKRAVTLEISSRTDNRNFRYMFYGFLAAWLVLRPGEELVGGHAMTGDRGHAAISAMATVRREGATWLDRSVAAG